MLAAQLCKLRWQWKIEVQNGINREGKDVVYVNISISISLSYTIWIIYIFLQRFSFFQDSKFHETSQISTHERPCGSSAKRASVATDCVDAVNLQMCSERFQDGGWMGHSWFMGFPFHWSFSYTRIWKLVVLWCFSLRWAVGICDTCI